MNESTEFLLGALIGVAASTVALRYIPKRFVAFFVGYIAFVAVIFLKEYILLPKITTPPLSPFIVTTLSELLGTYLVCYAISFFGLKKWWNIQQKKETE